MTPDTSGPGSPKPLVYFDPESSSWRTWPPTSGEASTLSPQTWPRSGMTRRGRLFALPTSAHHTAESASSSLLPTPSAHLGTNGRGMPGPELAQRRLDSGRRNLEDSVVNRLLPTPTTRLARGPADLDRDHPHGPALQDVVAGRLLPTPTARDHKGHNQRADSTCLPGAVLPLLPTPTRTGHSGNHRNNRGELLLPGVVATLHSPSETSNPTATRGDSQLSESV
jgi:hypothetical protein